MLLRLLSVDTKPKSLDGAAVVKAFMLPVLTSPVAPLFAATGRLVEVGLTSALTIEDSLTGVGAGAVAEKENPLDAAEAGAGAVPGKENPPDHLAGAGAGAMFGKENPPGHLGGAGAGAMFENENPPDHLAGAGAGDTDFLRLPSLSEEFVTLKGYTT